MLFQKYELSNLIFGQNFVLILLSLVGYSNLTIIFRSRAYDKKSVARKWIQKGCIFYNK